MITNYKGQALIVANKIPLVLKQRGLDPLVVARYDLWEGRGGTVWLSAILDAARVGKSEHYTHPQMLHQLSTVLRGKPVILSNSSGLRYCILLSHRPQLPKRAPAPPWRKGVVQIGRSLKGEITAGWHHDENGIGHVLTAAMNRYGKSTLLKHLAWQAVQEGFQLVLIDPRGATFAKLRGHAQVLAYVGDLEASVSFLSTHLLSYMDRRASVHQQHGVDKYENLPDSTLPRLVILIDEYNEILRRAEGKQRKAVSDAVVTMAFGSPKYGVHLVVAGHYFQKEDADRLKDQFITKVVFRLESKEAARMLLDTDAPTRIWSKGCAMTNRWGLIQTYYAELDDLPAGDGLTETERGLITRLKAEYTGRITYDALKALGYGQRAAQRLREDWMRRGLARVDPGADNALILTI
jgi:hypothetical protein